MRGGAEEEGGADELRSGPSRSGTAAAEGQRETIAPEVRGETAHSLRLRRTSTSRSKHPRAPDDKIGMLL